MRRRPMTSSLAILIAAVVAIPRAYAQTSAAPATSEPVPLPQVSMQVPSSVLPAMAVSPVSESYAAELYASGESRRSGGIGLTILGSLLLVGSTGLFIAAMNQRNYFSDDGKNYATAGLLTMLGGAGALGAGIPLIVTGSRRMERARSMGYSPVALVPYAAPVQGGGVAGLQLAGF